MFQIKLDDYVLYDYRLDDLEHEDMIIENPKISLEANKTNSFQFKIHSNHRYFDKIKKMKSIIKVYNKNDLIFRGRILEDKQNFNKSKNVDCEGELAFLLDSIYRPYNLTTKTVSLKEFIINIINNHNNQVKDFQKFKIGTITVEDPNKKVNFSCENDTRTWKIFEEKIIPTYGGYIFITYDEEEMPIFNYYVEPPYTSLQKIEYGVNLLDISNLISAEDLATACIPRGARIKDSTGNETTTRLDITSVNNGKDYLIDKERAEEFGVIYADPNLVTFDDITTASLLKTKCQKILSNSVKLSQTLEIKANYLVEEKDIQNFKFLYYVNVISLKHGINEKYLLEKLDLDLFNISNAQITLGQVKKTLTDNSLTNRSNANQVIRTVEEVKNSQMTNENVVTILNQEIPNSEVFNETVSDILKNYDFSEKVSNILKDYDFSEKILNTLKTYNFYNIVSVVSNGITTLSDTNITNVSMKPNIIIGNKLSVSSKGEVIIGDNVNNIKVSTGIYIDSEFNESDIINISIQKNNTIVYSTMEKITQNGITIYGGLNVIGVKKGDIIKLCIQNETFGRGKIGGNNTFMNVEAI